MTLSFQQVAQAEVGGSDDWDMEGTRAKEKPGPWDGSHILSGSYQVPGKGNKQPPKKRCPSTGVA